MRFLKELLVLLLPFTLLAQNDLSRCNALEEEAFSTMETDEEEASELLQSAAICYKKGKDFDLWLYCQRTAASLLARNNRVDEAHDLLKSTLKVLSGQAGLVDITLLGELYMQMGYVEKLLGEFYLAKNSYENARRIHEKIAVVDNAGRYLYKPLASIYTRIGDNEKAMVLLGQAVDSCQLTGDEVATIEAYCELGIAKWDAGQLAASVNDLEEGMAKLADLMVDYPGEPGLIELQGIYLTALARTFLEQGKEKNAGQLAEMARKLLHGSDKRGPVLAVLGEVARSKGDYGEANRYFQQALEADTASFANDDRREVAQHELALSELALLEHRYDRALAYCQRALRRITLEFAGDGLFPDPAPEYYYPEVTLLQALRLKGAILYQKAEDEPGLDLALNTLKRAVRYEDFLRESYLYQSARYQVVSESHELHEVLLLALYEKYHRYRNEDSLKDAFFYLEKSRAVLLDAGLRESEALRAYAPEAVFDSLRELKIQVSYYKTKLFEYKSEGRKASRNELILKIDRLEEQYNNRLADLEEESRRFGHARKTGLVSLQQAQARLPGNTRILEYFYGKEAIYVMAIDRRKVTFERIEKPGDLDEQLRHFVDTLRNWEVYARQGRDPGLFTYFQQTGRQIYDLLVDRFVDGKSIQTLVFVPDGLLNSFPFDLCLYEDFSGAALSYGELPYLIRRYNLHQVSSVSLLMQGRGRRQGAVFDADYLGIAPDYSTCSLRDVQGGANVVRAMRELFAGKALLGEEASVAAFQELVGRYRMIHFHGHAKALNDDPGFSWLAFTHDGETGPVARAGSDSLRRDEGLALLNTAADLPRERERLLYAQEIAAMELLADLVVLSGCETGRGKIAAGEGQISLARSFLLAGCPSLLMSLWEAEDRATSDLIAAFFRYLEQGEGKAVALRRAKLDFLETAADVYPAFWAGFTLIGDGEAVFGGRAAIPRAYFILLAIGLALIWGFTRYYRKTGS